MNSEVRQSVWLTASACHSKLPTMAATKSPGKVIELHFADDQQVRVVPEDNDLMVIQTNIAVEACRAFRDQIRFKNQFDDLLNTLAQWIVGRRSKIAEAHMTVRDAGLLFLIVLNGTEYDSDFESELTRLDTEIANDSDFDLISLSVLALPKCDTVAVESFLSSKMKLRYAIDGNRS